MTVSLTLTFADLAQAEQAIAAIREKAISTIPAGSHGGSVCQHDQSGATASAIAGQSAVEGPEGGTTGQDAPAADPVTVASVAGLNANSPDLSLVQASAAEDRPPASAAPITPSAADILPGKSKAGEVPPSGLASTNLAGRDSGNPDSAILTAPAELSPAIAARQAGPTQPKIQKDEEDRAANPKRRPHCMNPSACGSYTARHCYSCRKALGESEAA